MKAGSNLINGLSFFSQLVINKLPDLPTSKTGARDTIECLAFGTLSVGVTLDASVGGVHATTGNGNIGRRSGGCATCRQTDHE
jgi:hypothetical protein